MIVAQILRYDNIMTSQFAQRYSLNVYKQWANNIQLNLANVYRESIVLCMSSKKKHGTHARDIEYIEWWFQ